MLSVMNSCGMYDYAGEWAYEVGMPAKSGVSGCIIAVIPGQIGICVYSPPRSADIIADERVICYGLRVEQLHELTAEHPNIMITILSNLTREFSERLRHANEEIGVLE